MEEKREEADDADADAALRASLNCESNGGIGENRIKIGDLGFSERQRSSFLPKTLTN